MFACNCLNVIIEAEGNNFEKVTPESLELTDEERSDCFFKQEILKVKKLKKISKSQSGLVKVRKVGIWNINRCINCDVHSHALHIEKGASLVLMSGKLLKTDCILNIKSSDLYSVIFNIVVNPNEIDFDASVSETYRNKEAEKIIKNINDTVSNYIRNEQVAVEERIRQYSDKQYEILNTLKDRAYRECTALMRVVHAAMLEPTSTSTNPYQSPVKPSLSERSSLNLNSVPGSPSSMGHSPKRPKSSLVDRKTPSSKDDDEELIFNFEENEILQNSQLGVMDGELDMRDDDEVEDANEEADEAGGISFEAKAPRRASQGIARSLPVKIPPFAPFTRSKSEMSSEELDDLPLDDKVDIAASIKALAKSVHGDNIFGELPRPRFSSQL